jgi:hypothetical protein
LPMRQRISHEIDMASAAWWVNAMSDPRIGADLRQEPGGSP